MMIHYKENSKKVFQFTFSKLKNKKSFYFNYTQDYSYIKVKLVTSDIRLLSLYYSLNTIFVEKIYFRIDSENKFAIFLEDLSKIKNFPLIQNSKIVIVLDSNQFPVEKFSEKIENLTKFYENLEIYFQFIDYNVNYEFLDGYLFWATKEKKSSDMIERELYKHFIWNKNILEDKKQTMKRIIESKFHEKNPFLILNDSEYLSLNEEGEFFSMCKREKGDQVDILNSFCVKEKGFGVFMIKKNFFFVGHSLDICWSTGELFDQNGETVGKGFSHLYENEDDIFYFQNGKFYSDNYFYNDQKLHGYCERWNTKNELIWKGEYNNGKEWNGEGTCELKDGNDASYIYKGKLTDGKPNGDGENLNMKNELIWKGEFKNGNFWSGEGISELKDGSDVSYIYKGKLVDGKPNGDGEKLNMKNELIWKGEFKDGIFCNGEGICELKDESDVSYIYKGKLTDGKPNGDGEKLNTKNELIWKGEFKKGVIWNGEGTCELKDENNVSYIYKGKLADGKPNGDGEKLNMKNELIWKGEFKDGNFWSGEGTFNKVINYKIFIYEGKMQFEQPHGFCKKMTEKSNFFFIHKIF